MVTFLGFPPNRSILAWTHLRASVWSNNPLFPEIIFCYTINNLDTGIPVTSLSSVARYPSAPCLLSTLTTTTSPLPLSSAPDKISSLPDANRTITPVLVVVMGAQMDKYKQSSDMLVILAFEYLN